MEDQLLLKMVKMNLEIRNSIQDEYLEHLIKAAKEQIRLEGGNLPDENYSELELQLITAQACHFYRDRATTQEGYQTAALHPQGEPYHLRYGKNCYIIAHKMETES